MGGRGGASHRVTNSVRIGRGQISLPSGRTALEQIIMDTGYTQAQASIAHQFQRDYYGSGYGSYTSGQLPNETEIISEALMKMPYYNGGRIWRGISMPDHAADSVFLNIWKPGTTQYFTDTTGNGNGVVQSFSSKEHVAESFSNWDGVSSGRTAIKFIVDGNKTAPGVQHISGYGVSEAEVLSPSYQQFRVERIVQVSDSRWGGRRFEIYITDLGRKKK